jgi:hypothetical protein
MIQWNKCKLIVESGKPKLKANGMKVHHDDFKMDNSLEWQSAVTSMRWWSNWKKDLWLPKPTFSNIDENLSLMGLHRGQFNTKLFVFKCIVRIEVP